MDWGSIEVEPEERWPEKIAQEWEEIEQLRRSLALAQQQTSAKKAPTPNQSAPKSPEKKPAKSSKAKRKLQANTPESSHSSSQSSESVENGPSRNLPTNQATFNKTPKHKKSQANKHDKYAHHASSRSSSQSQSASTEHGPRPPPRFRRISDIGAWVRDFLTENGLEWAIKYFEKINFSLELVPYIDGEQLDDLLTLAKCEIKKSQKVDGGNEQEPAKPSTEIDPIEKIKLVCALRAMKTQLQAQAATPPEQPAQQPEPSTTQRTQSQVASQQQAAPQQAAELTTVATNAQQLASGLRSLLAPQDIMSWTPQQVADWVVSIPQLAHMKETFLANNIDGKALLRLSDKKMALNLRLASPIDRRLLLQHIADLKAIQFTYSTGAYQDIINKIVKQLGTELELLKMNGKRKKPNAFLSLRINNPEIQAKVREIQEKVTTAIPLLKGSKCILPPEQLHFTIGRLYIETPEDKQKAIQLLERCDIVFNQIYKGKPMSVTFKGIANYGGNALFLEVEPGIERDNLVEFGSTVFEIFKETSVASRQFRFQPVAPFIRIHAAKRDAIQPLQTLSASTLVPEYADVVLGRHTFAAVEISSVASETEADGYYKAIATCPLTPQQ